MRLWLLCIFLLDDLGCLGRRTKRLHYFRGYIVRSIFETPGRLFSISIVDFVKQYTPLAEISKTWVLLATQRMYYFQ